MLGCHVRGSGLVALSQAHHRRLPHLRRRERLPHSRRSRRSSPAHASCHSAARWHYRLFCASHARVTCRQAALSGGRGARAPIDLTGVAALGAVFWPSLTRNSSRPLWVRTRRQRAPSTWLRGLSSSYPLDDCRPTECFWDFRNLPVMTILTRSPFGSGWRVTSRSKSIALMVPSPNSSSIKAFTVVP